LPHHLVQLIVVVVDKALVALPHHLVQLIVVVVVVVVVVVSD